MKSYYPYDVIDELLNASSRLQNVSEQNANLYKLATSLSSALDIQSAYIRNAHIAIGRASIDHTCLSDDPMAMPRSKAEITTPVSCISKLCRDVVAVAARSMDGCLTNLSIDSWVVARTTQNLCRSFIQTHVPIIEAGPIPVPHKEPDGSTKMIPAYACQWPRVTKG